MTPNKIFEERKLETLIGIRVIPGAKKNEISEILDDGRIKIRLTARPIGGKANEALKKFLAETLNIGVRQIEVIKGNTNREKLVLVRGVGKQTIYNQIIENIKSVHR